MDMSIRPSPQGLGVISPSSGWLVPHLDVPQGGRLGRIVDDSPNTIRMPDERERPLIERNENHLISEYRFHLVEDPGELNLVDRRPLLGIQSCESFGTLVLHRRRLNKSQSGSPPPVVVAAQASG